MGDLITRFTNLFNLSKTVAVTVPGLVAAAALGLMLRPTLPTNDIAIYKGQSNCEFDYPKPLLTTEKFSFESYRVTAKANQHLLDTSRVKLQDCIAQRTSELGSEEAEIADLKLEVELRSKEREVYEKKYLQYVESWGRLRSTYEQDMQTLTRRIIGTRKTILDIELAAKKRQLEIDRLKAYLKTVDERLADPGRLRPALGFTEYFEGLTSKILAFVLFAMAIGFTLDPFNRAFFGTVFDWQWVLYGLNWVRAGRFQVIR